MAGGGEVVVVLSLLPGGRILVAVEPVDGRKGIDSLAGVVRSVLLGNPLSGDLFVFKNKGADKLKILAWMGDGFALYLRRLERGTFAFPQATATGVVVTPTQLAMILGGLDPAKAKPRKRFELSKGS
jgi:transposase